MDIIFDLCHHEYNVTPKQAKRMEATAVKDVTMYEVRWYGGRSLKHFLESQGRLQ